MTQLHKSRQRNVLRNHSSRAGLVLAVVYITALFFIWAFVTNLIDPLVKSMKVIYTLSDAEAQLTQFAFFIAYAVMSVPSGMVYGFAVDKLQPHFPLGARSLAFLVPLACYVYVLWFARSAARAPTHAIEAGLGASH